MKKIIFMMLILFFTACGEEKQIKEEIIHVLSWEKVFEIENRTYASSVLIDSSGDVYVVGKAVEVTETAPYQYSSQSRIFIKKWSENGTELWEKQFGEENDYYVVSATVDNNGNLYATGYVAKSYEPEKIERNIFVGKWSKDGMEEWFEEWGGEGIHSGSSIFSDLEGNIYISGNAPIDPDELNYIEDFCEKDHDCAESFLAKFKPDGSRLWTKKWKSNYSVVSLATDNRESVYVKNSDLMIKFNTAGDKIWSKSFSGNEIYVGVKGNIYTIVGLYDTQILKINDNGELIWEKITENINGRSLSGDSFGNIYITGSFYNPEKARCNPFADPTYCYDLFIMKIDPDGNEMWRKNWDYEFGNRGISIAVDNLNNIFITGYTDLEEGFIIKWSSENPKK